jgi:hypothetical protein
MMGSDYITIQLPSGLPDVAYPMSLCGQRLQIYIQIKLATLIWLEVVILIWLPLPKTSEATNIVEV